MENLKHTDIWTLKQSHWIVIPTNVGWKKDGANVMGRGIAQQAARYFPSLPNIYGEHCRIHGEKLYYISSMGAQLICFPTKPLADIPWLSWRGPATLEQIEISLKQLAEETEPVAIPLVGCGNGGLDPSKVVPLIEKYLTAPNFTLVTT